MARTSGDFDAVGPRRGSRHPVRRDHVLPRRPLARQPQLLSEGPEGREGRADDDEIIRAFLLQYYGGREAPKEILVSRAVPEAAALAEMLSAQSGHKVAIKSRVRGDRARLVEMAVTNARHGAELRYQASASYEGQLEALAEALDLARVAEPARVLRHQPHGRRGDGRVVRRVRLGRAAEVRLPALQHRRRRARRRLRRDDAGAHAALRAREAGRGADAGRAVHRRRAGPARAGDRACSASCRSKVRASSASRRGRTASPGARACTCRSASCPLHLPPSSPALHLIQQIRDEAHRFAITGHRARRQKARTRSPLEDIRGLGPKRRRELLRQFGGLQALTRAGVDDLMRVKGISRQLAESIYEHFHAD